MHRSLKLVVLSVTVLLVYLFLWPVPIKPVAWNAQTDLGFVGDFRVNTRLDSFDKMTMGALTGPEAAVHNQEGVLYASTHEGWIIRWPAGQQQAQKWVNVGGRPLGVDFDAQGNLWIANAHLGLMKLTPKGQLSTELTEADGEDIQYADDLAVAPNGKLYLSDASTRFPAKASSDPLEASFLDIMEHSSSGRIIEFDPSNGESRVIHSNLTFANGVAVDSTGDTLYFSETGKYRVWRMALNGSDAFKGEILIDNLPGFVDNVHMGMNGRIWLGLTSPRSTILDNLANKPFWRKVIQRLPAFLKPDIVAYGAVIAIDKNGKVLHNLQSPSGAVYATTGVAESVDYIYVTSLTAPFLARYSKKQLQIP